MKQFSNLAIITVLVSLFFVLHSLFFSAPARAAVSCPDGGFVYDPTLPEIWQCCNYENSLNHIPADTPDCNSTHCQTQNFAKNADSNTYGEVCRYCNRNVTVRIDGCSGCGCTCNQVCAGGGPPDEECPVPDYETDPCCGGFTLNPSSEATASGLLTATITFNGSELRHAHVQNLKEDYYGGEEGGGGTMIKLMPPNYLYAQDAVERQRIDAERGAWGIKTGDGSKGVIGSDPFFFQLNFAMDFLGRSLMPPIQEGSPTSLKESSQELCATTPINIDLTDALTQLPNYEGSSGTVLAADDEVLCHEALPGPKHSACVAQSSVGIDFGEAVGGIFRGIDIFPSFSFLRNIFTRTLGSGTEGEPGGFFRIFDLPGEEHENLDGEVEESNFTLKFSIGGVEIPFFQKTLSFKNEEGKGGVWNTGTEAKADEGIKQKLSVPQAENGTTGYRTSTTPSVVLASTQNSINTRAPLSPLTPLDLSLAEKLGRTLGSWLGRLIAL